MFSVVPKPFQQAANPQTESRLLRQPTELVQASLGFVDGPSLLKKVAPACQRLNALLTDPVFKNVYGPGPVHRRDIIDWKQLVMDQVAIRENLQNRYPAGTTLGDRKAFGWARDLVSAHYTLSDTAINREATECLVRLQESAERDTPSWLSGVIVALTAQGHPEVAQPHMERLNKVGGMPAKFSLLLNARYGSAFPGNWDDIPEDERSHVRDTCALGAAMAGNVELLKELRATGFDLARSVAPPTAGPRYTAAICAATNGRVNVLEYLRAKGVDILARPDIGDWGRRRNPLWYAAANNQGEAVRFLLATAGGEVPELKDAFANALRLGHVDAARAFVAHDSTLAATLDRGCLLLAGLGDGAKAPVARSIAYLVNEAGVDINAKDNNGHTIAHIIAGRSSDRDLLAVLHEHGADFSITDNAGDNPLEIVYRDPQHDKALVQWLVETTPNLRKDFLQEKERIAKALLTRHRAAILQQHAGIVRIAGVDAAETRKYVEACYVEDDMESVLAHTYAKEISYESLEELTKQDALPAQDYGLTEVFRRFAVRCQSNYRLRAPRF